MKEEDSKSLNNEFLAPSKPNSYTPISAPVSFKLVHLNTEATSTLSLAERMEANICTTLEDSANLVPP
jgi:hypothetical protein